jgi:hypothetical protein
MEMNSGMYPGEIGYITSTDKDKVNFNRSVILLVEEEETHEVETVSRSNQDGEGSR